MYLPSAFVSEISLMDTEYECWLPELGVSIVTCGFVLFTTTVIGWVYANIIILIINHINRISKMLPELQVGPVHRLLQTHFPFTQLPLTQAWGQVTTNNNMRKWKKKKRVKKIRWCIPHGQSLGQFVQDSPISDSQYKSPHTSDYIF